MLRARALTSHDAGGGDDAPGALLGDAARLREWGLDASIVETLAAAVPPTEVVDAAHAERLWKARRGLFFKPVAGYGGKAAYRGDKITRTVWASILAGD